MMKNKLVKLMLIGGFGISAGLANAQNLNEISTHLGEQSNVKVQENVFLTLDKNQDGQLSTYEATQWTNEQFKSADKDSNGFLSKEEIISTEVLPDNRE